ncbi:hypothetical protein QN277_000316 [Acacia crassicarpa]|uniref:Transmembrane 9 superfamily member n=1 Tax=Acacia crassicarpa TaxID=499986 RepID=A0AAE1N531_9FABA|nr:hypothetical protein QN277_000316 [Acacia crassicarpa]
MGKVVAIVFIVFIALCGISQVKADASDHRYKEGDMVPFYVSKVGPFRNPSESYRYYDLPFCKPDHLKEKKEALGEVLIGERLYNASYHLEFRRDKSSKVLCKKTLKKEEVAKFRSVVQKDYYYEMYYDDLPVWGFIGGLHQKGIDPSDNTYLYNRIHFDIFYNKDRVIQINLIPMTRSRVDLTEDKEIDVEFLYSAKWKETDTPFEKRRNIYYFHFSSSHWFSIINSCVPSLLLSGFLAAVTLWVLKRDFVKCALGEESAEGEEVTGWKNLHGDVFRFPKYKCLFAASLGSGTQLFTLTVFIFILAFFGVFYPYDRGALFTALIVIYALTSVVAGYTATTFYCQLEGMNWIRNLLFTGFLFAGPLFLTFCFLNTVAIAYNATIALPFGKVMVIVLIWTLVALPLLVLGGLVGKKKNNNNKAEFQAPCRTTSIPREIPPMSWYRRAFCQVAVAGLLPFGVLCIELDYIFGSLWEYRTFSTYHILFMVFIILSIVTAAVTVALTYFQLAAEDHEWWWRSFMYGGSAGAYAFAYCCYYYYARSNISGFLQISFFFGYMACICYAFFLMLGTLGFHAALLFVRYLYGSIKHE